MVGTSEILSDVSLDRKPTRWGRMLSTSRRLQKLREVRLGNLAMRVRTWSIVGSLDFDSESGSKTVGDGEKLLGDEGERVVVFIIHGQMFEYNFPTLIRQISSPPPPFHIQRLPCFRSSLHIEAGGRSKVR
jgi:hypothetical protein